MRSFLYRLSKDALLSTTHLFGLYLLVRFSNLPLIVCNFFFMTEPLRDYPIVTDVRLASHQVHFWDRLLEARGS